MADAEDGRRLLADAMLGALARWLRVLDLDTAYDPELDDPELVEKALEERRVLLTRDRKLVERKALRGRHLLIESEVVDRQVRQVLSHLDWQPPQERLFRRCLRCNEALERMAPEEARRFVAPYIARTQERFRRCPSCERIYWASSHVRRMRKRLARMGVGVGD
jgi:uncharacterized protein with PIN domain